MPDNDNDLGVDIPETPELPEAPEGQQDSTDWKAKALELQGQLKESRGIAKRFQTRLRKTNEAPKTAPEAPAPAPQASKGFDYAQKAYLKSSGIQADEFDLIKEVMDSTGKDIDAVLGSEWFQKELKEQREHKATAAATPKGGSRASNPTQDTVEYWLTKLDAGSAKVSDIPDRALRTKVVNARIARASGKNNFYNS